VRAVRVAHLGVWFLFLDGEVGRRCSVEFGGSRGLADFAWDELFSMSLAGHDSECGGQRTPVVAVDACISH